VPVHVTKISCVTASLSDGWKGLSDISDLAKALSLYPSVVHPLFKSSYQDWLKVLDCICQLFAMLKPGDRLCVHAKDCVRTWVDLGNAFGYVEELRCQLDVCAYTRCSGASSIIREQLVCKRCLLVSYCCVQCQRA
jgi:hypothetical protein